MTSHRDVGAFEERAAGYERGWLGRLHHEIADRTAALAVATTAPPKRVLDVGCGSGYLLRVLSNHFPDAEELAGLDAAPAMIKAATASAGDQRLTFSIGVAEKMPYPDGTFDLVVSTTSFDHWSDQQAGLSECARVLGPGGHLILADQFSAWPVPSLIISRPGKARTKRLVNRLLAAAGFRSLVWHELYAVIIKAVIATT
jgi:ubiquinone/menaquinone biosynthesis C-methylase UbiE